MLGLFSVAELTCLPSYLVSQRHASLWRMRKEIPSCNSVLCLLNGSERDGLWGSKAVGISISLFYLDLFCSSVVRWSLNDKPSSSQIGPMAGLWVRHDIHQLPLQSLSFSYSGNTNAKQGHSEGQDPIRPKSTRAEV